MSNHGSSSLWSSNRGSSHLQTRSSTDNVMEGTSAGRSTIWQKYCSCFFRRGNPGSIVSYRIVRCLKSRAWKMSMIGFSVFLLFGSQIQHLWVPPSGDVVFDVLASVTFLFFLTDIIFRVIAEPQYLKFHFDMRRRRFTTAGNDSNTPRCVLGSFMFWCDVVSTGVSLYDISFVNPGQYSIVDVLVRLDDQGHPISGFDKFNRLRPVAVEFDLLITIARCARAARFVRSRVVVDASNNINWFWLCQRLNFLNPLRYLRKLKFWRRRKSLIHLGDDSAAFAGPGAGIDTKRTSWGGLQVSIMAALRARTDEQANRARGPTTKRQRMWYAVKKSLNTIGLMDSNRHVHMRHEAAIKIQRCWRAHVRYVAAASNDGGSLIDLATSNDEELGALSSNRSNYVNPVGKLLRGRSAFRIFGQMNAHAGGKLNKDDIKHSLSVNESAPESRFQSKTGKGRESQVGSDMRELTGQRVAIGVLLALVFTVVFTYTDSNTTPPTTMMVLHEQTANPSFLLDSLYSARNSSTPGLFAYQPINGSMVNLTSNGDPINGERLRDREQLRVTVLDTNMQESVGYFSFRHQRMLQAITELVATVFIIAIWFIGVTAFSGPVMTLVVVPIERMVRLLGMLMLDPLGYQSTARFRKFRVEEDALIRNTRWTKEVLKGMETSFLMSTILRIGSLMKVGFGSAGVEIIRNNLQKGQSKNMLILNSQGSTVSCIFLFCDIRQFTDATECLQEEVFVFTNQIAGVVHSICHSYGGAANKNVGDAFLLSWSLEDGESSKGSEQFTQGNEAPLRAKSNQADKALLSVIKICIALYYDNYYMKPLSDAAKNRLKTKLKNRSGPYVQMGFGLHAGKAVQGAIGSQRKIDATYVSEAVERAELLETLTKKYGLVMLMSDSFHRLLHQNTRRRCRKIDQILIQDDEEDEDEDDELQGERMDLYTFDMDVVAIHRPMKQSQSNLNLMVNSDTLSDAGSMDGDRTSRLSRSHRGDRRGPGSNRHIRNRRRSVTLRPINSALASEELSLDHSTMQNGSAPGIPSNASVGSIASTDDPNSPNYQGPNELVLPTGPALYSHNVWQSPDMKRIRDVYVKGLFFQKFNAGLQAYYKKDWTAAVQCFQTVLDNFDDGPSKYFLAQMKKHGGVPPHGFLEYGLA